MQKMETDEVSTFHYVIVLIPQERDKARSEKTDMLAGKK